MIAFFLHNPIGAIGYGLVILTLILFWVHRKVWLFAPLLLCSLAAAYFGGIIELKALIPLTILALSYFFAKSPLPFPAHFSIVLVAITLTTALFTHFIVGFHNVLLFSKWQASRTSLPINIYANYDKAVTAILILGLYSVPLISSKEALYSMLKKTLPWIAGSTFILLGLSLSLHLVTFDFKLPLMTPTWLLLQLFFCIIPEELFYRGFIQKEIRGAIKSRFAPLLAILITSVLFTLIHVFFVKNPSFLALVFVASLLYGGIYEWTKAIESSILMHLFINVTHFLLFSYPMYVAN